MLADPMNTTLRRVLMDALLAVNHPRATLWLMNGHDVGPFILEHVDALLGPLVDAVEPGFVFVDGWLQKATLKSSAFAGHPLWATVEALDARGDALTSKHPVMKSLRTLINSGARVTELTSPQLERLLAYDVSRVDAVALSSVNTLPLLTELHVRIAADDVVLLLPRAPVLQSLRLDVIDATPESAPWILERVFQLGLERMAFGFFDGALVFELWRRGGSYQWHSNRGGTEGQRARLDEAHRFVLWQLRALGVVT